MTPVSGSRSVSVSYRCHTWATRAPAARGWPGIPALVMFSAIIMSCAKPPPTSHQLDPVPEPLRGLQGQTQAQADGPEEENDVLQPGDVLRVNIWRQPEFSGDFAIGPDSVLVHPLYQDIKVGGLELTAARQRLTQFLSTYLQDAHLVVEPLYPVTVAGEVREPNLYHVTRGTTVAQAIAQAGGPTAEGRLDRVVLQRGGSNVTGSLTAEFSQFGALPVGSGDQIFVQRRMAFNFLRDVMAPVTNMAVLVLTIVRISNGK